MEQWWQIPQTSVRYWVDSGRTNSIRQKPHWKTTPTLQQDKKEVGTRNHGNLHWMQRVYKVHWVSAVPSNRRSRHAKDCTKSIQRSLEVETNLSLQSNKSDKGAFDILKALNLLQNGDTILLPQRIRLHLRHHDGNQAATCGQRGTGIRGNLHPGVNSELFSSLIVPDEWFLFRSPEI